MQSLQFENIFIGALQHPEFSWSNYFLIEQEKSEWAKGVFLTSLDEVYHHCKRVFRFHFDSKKRKNENLAPQDIKLPIKQLVGVENSDLLDEATLERLHYAIHRLTYFDKEDK